MPKPRHTQIALDSTPYYHCISRCVRQAFLCGVNTISGKNFDHRQQWIEDKLHALTTIFAMDLCAYAVMSNHYHVVLHVDKGQAESWERDEVITRWHRLFRGHALSQRHVQGDNMSAAEIIELDRLVSRWRRRLMSISWFMGILNESIARRANAEDGCSGRFWDGRFRCQALLDETALLACMAYVDLNPVRARTARTPERSKHTSIQRRCRHAQQSILPGHPLQQAKGLMPFVGNFNPDAPKGLPFHLRDYLQLVDWSGRILRDDKPGHIDQSMPDILRRLNIFPQHWLYLTRHFESRFKGMVGTAYKLQRVCAALGYQRTPGITRCRQYFSSG